jgi:spermidine/putrescine transport system permease protein
MKTILRSLLVALLIGMSAAYGGEELRLLCWSEYVPPAVIAGFANSTGVRVLVENYNSNEQMLAMLRARPDYYDLLQPSQFYVETLGKAGGLAPLTVARIPNVRFLDPKYCGLPHDPAGKFSVPWLAGTVGIVVNTERIKEPISTWADVFSGKYAGRIVVVDDAREMVAWALATLGLPITDVSDASLERVRPLLLQWLPQVKVFDSDSPKTALLDDRADLGIVWSGEAATLWQRDRKFRYILPAEGAHMFLDSLAIPTGAPHQPLAEAFINHCLDPEVSVLISKEYPYTNPNLAARALLTREELDNPASYPPGDPSLAPLHNTGNSPQAVLDFVTRLRSSLPKP